MRYLLLVATGAAALAFAATPANGETLQDALRATSSTNPQLEAQRVANTIAEEQLVAAKGARRPTVEVTAQYGPETIQTNRLIVLDQGGRQIGSTSLSATQPLYAGGRITAGIREARAGIGASEAQLKVIEQDTYLDTIVAYVDVRRDRETIAIRENSVTLLEEQFRAARDRFDVGEITRTDVALSEARLERARAQLAGAEAQLEASIATYEFIIGMTPGELAPPPEVTGVPASFEAALTAALEKSPDIEAAEFNEQAAEQRVKSARSQPAPAIEPCGHCGRAGDTEPARLCQFLWARPNGADLNPGFHRSQCVGVRTGPHSALSGRRGAQPGAFCKACCQSGAAGYRSASSPDGRRRLASLACLSRSACGHNRFTPSGSGRANCV